MYRYRAYAQVIYGHFNDVLKVYQELNAISRKRGWPEWTVWTPVIGTANEIVVEQEFTDLASFERANKAFQSDTEAMRVFRGAAGLVVQGSSHDELVEQTTTPLA
jgi:hypothetical protein